MKDFVISNCILPSGDIFRSQTLRLTGALRNHLRICSILNYIAFPPTLILNALVIISLAKSRDLRTKSKSNIFIISLCVSDLLSGLISQPIYAVSLYQQSYGVTSCLLRYVSFLSGAPLAIVSVSTVAGIAFERFLALFKPYTYERVITSKRIIRVLSAIWPSVFATFIVCFVFGAMNFFKFFSAAILVANICWNIFVYLKIQAYVRRLKRRIRIENNPVGHIENSDRHLEVEEFTSKHHSDCQASVELPLRKMAEDHTSKDTAALSFLVLDTPDRDRGDSYLTNFPRLQPQVQPRGQAITLSGLSQEGCSWHVDENHVQCTAAESMRSSNLASTKKPSLHVSNEHVGWRSNSIVGRLSFSVISPIHLTRKSRLSVMAGKQVKNRVPRNDNRRLAVFTISIIGTLLITYFPFVTGQFLRGFQAVDATTLEIFDCYCMTILALNSLLNPIIYLVQCPQIKRNVLQLISFRPKCIFTSEKGV